MRKLALVVGAVVVLGGAALVAASVFRSRAVSLDVTGAAGTKFTGSATVDGAKRDLSGVVPAHFEFEPKSLAFEIELPEADVAVDLDVRGVGHAKTSAGSPAPTHVVGNVDFTALSTAWHMSGSNRGPGGR